MPSTSDKQHRAMEAAAHGHSTLGIPKSVGQDFVAADMHKAHHENYNDDHHADHHIDAAHPHQQHSQPHHRVEKPPVSPNTKSYDPFTHSVRDGVPHHQHRHHVHDRRDKGAEHHPPTADGTLPGHVVNGGY